MQDIQQLEDRWNETGRELWEAEAEQDRVQHLYRIADEGRKVLAVLALYYAVRQFSAARAVRNAHKANERARDAVQAARAPEEVPSPVEEA